MAGRKKMTAAEATKLQPGQFLIQGSKYPCLLRYEGMFRYDARHQWTQIERMDYWGNKDSAPRYESIELTIHELQLNPFAGRIRIATPADVAAFEKRVLAHQTSDTKRFCRGAK